MKLVPAADHELGDVPADDDSYASSVHLPSWTSFFVSYEGICSNLQQSPVQLVSILLCVGLYITWLIIVYMGSIELDSMLVLTFAWVWIPVLAIQMSYHMCCNRYVLLGVCTYLLLVWEQYQVFLLSSSAEFTLFVDVVMLLHQTVVHISLRGGIAFPVWSFVLTTILCICMRYLTMVDQESYAVAVILNNTYLFSLAILSILMYPSASPCRDKKDSKQP
jgi:hypothetical protein